MKTYRAAALISAPLVAVLLSAGPGLAAENPSQTYCGTLMNGDRGSEHVTILTIRPDKLLVGEYTFADGGNATKGTLREIPDDDGDPQTVTLRWTDPYGSGMLAIRFDSDYASFEGKWGSGEETPDKLWFGDPCR